MALEQILVTPPVNIVLIGEIDSFNVTYCFQLSK